MRELVPKSPPVAWPPGQRALRLTWSEGLALRLSHLPGRGLDSRAVVSLSAATSGHAPRDTPPPKLRSVHLLTHEIH